jgi:hypothetical protein
MIGGVIWSVRVAVGVTVVSAIIGALKAGG